MRYTKGKISTLVMVLRQPFYALISIISGAALGLLYYYLTLSIMPVSVVAEAFGLSYVVASFALTIVTAILAGINISLLVFKIKGSRLITIKGTGSSTTFGSALAAFTPGCPACTTPLVAILSTIGGIAIFPLQGLELKLIAIVALLFSIYWILRSLRPLYRMDKR